MKLCIDIGNTFIKVAVFDREQKVFFKRYKKFLVADIVKLRKKYGFKRSIVSASGQLPTHVVKHLRKHDQGMVLSHKMDVPVKNLYKTPKTLGMDRLAAVIGASALFPKQSCAVIDIGTCITFDVIQKGKKYVGGNISPGIEMRLKAMDKFTANLPLVKRGKIGALLGDSTTTALQNGGTLGVLLEIESFINRVQKKYKMINVILTGGDADFFAKHLKTKIFVNPDLVLIGLNEILDHHA